MITFSLKDGKISTSKNINYLPIDEYEKTKEIARRKKKGFFKVLDSKYIYFVENPENTGELIPVFFANNEQGKIAAYVSKSVWYCIEDGDVVYENLKEAKDSIELGKVEEDEPEKKSDAEPEQKPTAEPEKKPTAEPEKKSDDIEDIIGGALLLGAIGLLGLICLLDD